MLFNFFCKKKISIGLVDSFYKNWKKYVFGPWNLNLICMCRDQRVIFF